MHFAFFLLRVGHNEIIGVNRVGSHAEGLGRDHWNEMLAYPRKPIAHWHPLLEATKSQKEVGRLLRFPDSCFIKEGITCNDRDVVVLPTLVGCTDCVSLWIKESAKLSKCKCMYTEQKYQCNM